MLDDHPARRVTLQRHILESQRHHPGASGELSVLLTQVAYAGKIFSKLWTALKREQDQMNQIQALKVEQGRIILVTRPATK